MTNLYSALSCNPQYTVNGKRIEIAVKQIVSGSDLKPSGTVANPESLQLYYKYRDLPTSAPNAKL
jgi:acetoacetyl-CoA synthetase